ncbi:MAG: putative signal peptide protein [Acidobacteriaceae bacterium]|nr:putative signal peptide protein [Acidobacteriaceae bacterium]
MKAIFLLVLMAYSSAGWAKPDRKDEIIAKAVQAMGGIERIHALHSLIYRGFHYEGSYKQEYAGTRHSTAVMVRMRPGLRLVGCRPEVPGCDGNWGWIVEGFDGTRGWELNWPKQRLVRTVNKAERALRCGAAFDYLFIDYKERGFHAKYLGRKRVLGETLEAVEIGRDECSAPVVYYFDPSNFDLRMREMAIPVHARGDAVNLISVSHGFKIVNGVKLSSREEEVNLRTGDVVDGGEWTSIEANTVDDRKVFEAPSVHPAGITAVVLEMLAQTGDLTPKQMLEMYTRFRTSEEGRSADVTYDMNWLGFELLKVDKYDYALPVLKQVIDENPTSGTAFASLGEAYLQMKDNAKAMESFQHAVDLGLKDEDVDRKLSRLRGALAKS